MKKANRKQNPQVAKATDSQGCFREVRVEWVPNHNHQAGRQASKAVSVAWLLCLLLGDALATGTEKKIRLRQIRVSALWHTTTFSVQNKSDRRSTKLCDRFLSKLES
jgi:hypothetical protein